jgi:hypothetical protein
MNVLPGPGCVIGEYMAVHPEIDKIAFKRGFLHPTHDLRPGSVGHPI